MPYTPPSQRSPATSKPNSPILSRNHSYSEIAPETTARPQRPALPRSVSSTSYLHKHRRTPSFNTANNTAANGQTANANVHAATNGHGPSANGSLRQSPPPVNSLLIPSGAITTPPDSSDDDDERGRNLQELQDAVHAIDLEKRPHSPSRDGAADTPVNTPVNTMVPSPVRSLSAEARKISHSRSSSEMNLSTHNITPLNTEAISSAEGSDFEDDELRMKPPLLRKKSGELVKPALRPSYRRRPSSMPGTPTYHKAVHFNENMEQVRHFLQIDRPIAVSAGSSPVETYDSESEYPFHEEGYRSKNAEWEIKLANFPSDPDSFERQTMPVRVEKIFLAPDNKTLVGTVACANLSFQKLVVARFTLDYWKTTSEVVAEFNHDVRKQQSTDGYDRFNFNIKLADQANLASKTLLLCVRYNVNGQEFWDSNNSMNYQVDFVRKPAKNEKVKKSGTAALGAIPRSRHSPPATRPRSMPSGSSDDDFSHGFDAKFEFGHGDGILGDSPSSSIRLKPKSKRGSLFPDQAPRRNASGQAFSTRYDFGASLSAALSNAQTVLGDRSGIKPNEDSKVQKGYFDKAKPSPAVVSAAAFPSEKPDLQSAEYNELIQKFCFVRASHPGGMA
jgi:hypothetical protein